jgi:uncharacterized membrane protein
VPLQGLGEATSVSTMSSVLERPGAPSADVATSASSTAVGSKPRVADGKQRVAGVDVARGVALVGMMAVHAFPTFTASGTPTVATVVSSGRSATTFVLLAGVGLAFLSGGPAVVHGRTRTAVAAGLAVRAVLIGGLGLALGLLQQFTGSTERPILPFYGLLFLLAIPLLGLAPLALAGIAVAAITLGPVLLIATADAGLPYADTEIDPVPADLLHDPLGLLVRLGVTGEYPAVVYIAYLCAGLAIGRLALTSRRVAWWLLGAGASLAVTARIVSAIVLYPLGGLARLIAEGSGGDGEADAAQTLLWDHGDGSSSWWYLAIPAPHSHTPIDLVHTLGSAMAVLGAALLLTRVPVIARLLRPLAVAGTMVLTLYSAHLVVLATGVLEDRPGLLYLLMLAGAFAFALLWNRWFGQGPLEKLVARPATAARGWVTRRAERRATASTSSGGRLFGAARRGAQFLAPLACAGVLALMFFAGFRAAAPGDTGGDVTDPAGVSEVSDVSEAPDLSDVSEAETPDPVAEQAPDADPTEAPSTTADEPWRSASTLWTLGGISAAFLAMMFLIGRLSSESPVERPAEPTTT